MNKNIPLFFSDAFNPENHPICEHSQVSQPDGIVSVRIGEANCEFQLDIYRISQDQISSFHQSAFEGCDLTAAFRWSEFNGANSISAQLAAATLVLASEGRVIWPRAKNGYYVGLEAYKVISQAAFREAKTRAGKNYSFSKSELFGPVVAVEATSNGAIKCPRCDKKFKLSSASSWDGEKHLSCGQLIKIGNDSPNRVRAGI